MISSTAVFFTMIVSFIIAGLLGNVFFRDNAKNARIYLISLLTATVLFLGFFYINEKTEVALLASGLGLDVGFFTHNPISLALFGIVTGIYFIFLLFRPLSVDESRPLFLEITGSVLSLSGLWMAVFSATAWTALGSIALIMVSGLLVERRLLVEHVGSGALLRAFFLKFASWLLMLVGVVISASSGAKMIWITEVTPPASGSDLSIGLIIFFIGALVGVSGFPAFPVATEDAENEPLINFDWSAFWYPGLAIFVLSSRLYPYFISSGLQRVLFFTSLFSTLFTFVAAVAQSDFDRTISRVRAGCLALTLTLLIDLGVYPALSFLMCIFMGSVLFNFIRTNNANRSIYLETSFKILIGLLFLGGPGLLGSLGIIGWFSEGIVQSPLILSLKIILYFIMSISIWKMIFLKRAPLLSEKNNNLVELLAVSLFIITASSAMLWWGDWLALTQGWLNEDTRTWLGLFGHYKVNLNVIVGKDIVKAIIIQMSIVWIVLAVVYWLIVRRPGQMSSISARWPKAVGFIENGYGVLYVLRTLYSELKQFSEIDQEIVQDFFWKNKVPYFTKKVAFFISKSVTLFDEKIQISMRKAATRGVLSMTRVTQLLQSGDFQWYLQVGLIAALVMILNILRG